MVVNVAKIRILLLAEVLGHVVITLYFMINNKLTDISFRDYTKGISPSLFAVYNRLLPFLWRKFKQFCFYLTSDISQ